MCVCVYARARARARVCVMQGIDLEKHLAHKLSVGSVAFSVTMMVFGGLMLCVSLPLSLSLV